MGPISSEKFIFQIIILFENAVKEKCRKCIDRLYDAEVKRMTDDDTVTTIPADKNTVVNNAVVKTAKQRQDEEAHPE